MTRPPGPTGLRIDTHILAIAQELINPRQTAWDCVLPAFHTGFVHRLCTRAVENRNAELRE